MSFLAICRSQTPLLIFFASSSYQRAEIVLRMSLQNKRNMNNYQKVFIKQSIIKQSQLLSAFLFWLTTVWVLFLFPYQRVCKFENWQDFISKLSLYIKNGENLKILIEIFRQDVIFSDISLVFLDQTNGGNQTNFRRLTIVVTNIECSLISKSLDPLLV